MHKYTTEELRTSKGDLEKLKSSPRHKVVLVLDNIRSTYNVGAMFRTADATRIEAIYLCGITAAPPHKGILKVALGTVDWVPWKYFKNTTDAIKELKENGYKIVALEQTDESIDYKQFDWNSCSPHKTDQRKDRHNNLTIEQFNNCCIAIIVGYEVEGISQEVLDLCDTAVDIPMSGFSHSLNVATAAGIILYQATSK